MSNDSFWIQFIQCIGSLCCLGLAVMLYFTGEEKLSTIAYLCTFIFLWIIPLLYIIFRRKDNNVKPD